MPSNSIINISGIKIYAYHGCLPQEAKIGGEYTVDVKVDFDFSKSAQTDDLKDTVDYVVVQQIVRDQMAIRNNLIENVVVRIANALKAHYANASFEVTLIKHAPPMNADVKEVSVVYSI